MKTTYHHGIEPAPGHGLRLYQGYILFSGASSIVPNAEIVPRKVEFFCETDRKTAEKFLSDGGFYWHAGIFVWKAAHSRFARSFSPET